MMSFNFTHTFRSLSAVLALQKLFKTYYYSAGCGFDEFCFNPYDSAFYDLLNVHCFSTENTNFYVTGSSQSRIEKLDFISQFEPTHRYLNVCNSHDENCPDCEKCIRTMACLYALDKLELYAPVFDVKNFQKNLAKRLAFVMTKKYDGSIEGNAFKDIIADIRKNKRKIPILSYIYAIPYFLKFAGIGLVKKSKFLKRLWHRRMSAKSGIRYNDK